jgi:hypothetical protein
MVARLWWKEARLIWPIAALLAVVSVAAQWLVIHYLGKEARTGGLPLLALGWTCLYGFSVASATLAGERENRTLLLLDSLPVARWRLWAAKSSFAVGSTLVLGALLAGIGALYTDSNRFASGEIAYLILGGSLVLLQVLGWGLFWSAVCGSALTAAVLAVCSCGLMLPLFDSGVNLRFQSSTDTLAQIGIATATMLGSALLFIRSGPPNRPLFPLGGRVHQARVVSAYEEARRSRRRQPRTWPRAVLSLAWQALRELGGLWWKLALVSLFMPFLLMFWIGHVDASFLFLVNVGIGILAGVNVLGTEYGVRSHRFLANHAVRPGMIWLVRTAIWLAAQVPLWAPALLVTLSRDAQVRPNRGVESLFAATVALYLGSFAIGLLCGMTIRRGITAGMVALVIVIAGAVPLGFLTEMGVVPAWVGIAIPLVFLGTTWAWSGDWLLALSGARKWIKLALLALVGFGGLFGLYVFDRTMMLPALDPVTEDRMFRFSTDRGRLAPEENAASLYREAAKLIRASSASAPFDREQVLRLIRRAAELPACRFVPIESMTEFTTPEPGTENCITFVPLLEASARDSMASGDLGAAWDEIAVLFKVARHWSGAIPLVLANQGLYAERPALSLALVWAADPRQTLDSLSRALDAYRKLPPIPPAADTIRAEALILQNTERQPRDMLADRLLEWKVRPTSEINIADKLWVDVVTTPWELTRARKVGPLLHASKIAEAERPAWRRVDEFLSYESWSGFPTRFGDPSSTLSGYELWRLHQTTPLVRQLSASFDGLFSTWDRNEVGRRAVLQALALRLWQVRHDGHLPRGLTELIPSTLEALPEDPFEPGGKHFGYVRSSGQPLLPLGDLEPLGLQPFPTRTRPVEDSWLLYSVGPDLRDDRAQVNDSGQIAKGDIIFPLPERNALPRRK